MYNHRHAEYMLTTLGKQPIFDKYYGRRLHIRTAYKAFLMDSHPQLRNPSQKCPHAPLQSCLSRKIQRSKTSWVRYPVWQHTFVSSSAFSRRAVVSYWRKYVHEVLTYESGVLPIALRGPALKKE